MINTRRQVQRNIRAHSKKIPLFAELGTFFKMQFVPLKCLLMICSRPFFIWDSLLAPLWTFNLFTSIDCGRGVSCDTQGLNWQGCQQLFWAGCFLSPKARHVPGVLPALLDSRPPPQLLLGDSCRHLASRAMAQVRTPGYSYWNTLASRPGSYSTVPTVLGPTAPGSVTTWGPTSGSSPPQRALKATLSFSDATIPASHFSGVPPSLWSGLQAWLQILRYVTFWSILGHWYRRKRLKCMFSWLSWLILC